MAFAGVVKRWIYCVGKEVNKLESKEKVDGEIKDAPPVGRHVVVSQGDFQMARKSAGWRDFLIVA